jgi:hypothetical protein
MQVCPGHNHIYIKANELRGEIRQPLHSAVTVSLNESDITAIDISQIAQSLLKRVE